MSYEAWGEPEDSRFDAAIEAGWIDPTDQSKALIDVMNERQRQQDAEGWTPEHDDEHSERQLERAATCYVWAASLPTLHREYYAGKNWGRAGIFRSLWPWEWRWWKPTDRRRDLVKAAALILAAIERLDRLAARAGDSA